MAGVSFAALVLAVACWATAQEQESCELTPSTRPRDPPTPHLGPRPAVVGGKICSSDPFYNSTKERLFMVNVLVRNEKCRALVGVAVEVEQADSRGVESADCGGRFVTDEFGRFSFTSVRPRHYNDVEFGRRPRTIQFRVRIGECNDEHVTQFYLKKDRRRKNDPCPVEQCHSNNELLLFRSSRRRIHNHFVRDNEVTITVRSTCSDARLQPETTEVPTTVAPTTAAPTTAAPTTAAPTFALSREACVNPRRSPWDAIGPFYKGNQPTRTILCYDAYWSVANKTELTVHLRDEDCNDLAGVPIDVWHANHVGQYTDHCRTLMTTNSSGMFTVNGIKPAPYLGRPPHYHYMVHGDRAPQRADGCRYFRFNTQSYWPERYDNSQLIKKCTGVFENGIKVRDRCLFTITMARPRC